MEWGDTWGQRGPGLGQNPQIPPCPGLSTSRTGVTDATRSRQSCNSFFLLKEIEVSEKLQHQREPFVPRGFPHPVTPPQSWGHPGDIPGAAATGPQQAQTPMSPSRFFEAALPQVQQGLSWCCNTEIWGLLCTRLWQSGDVPHCSCRCPGKGTLVTGEEPPKSRSCLADTFSVCVSVCSPPWHKQKHLWGLFRGL